MSAAEKLFANKGFEATTVRDIADAAGVNLAMISYYFGSKEKLLEALFAERMATGAVRIKEIIQMKNLDPWQKIQQLIDGYVAQAVQKQDFFKVMVSEQVINKNPAVIAYLKNLRLQYLAFIGSIISEGQKKKMFAKKIDLYMLLTLMTGTVKTMIINQEFYRDALKRQKLPFKDFQKTMIENLQTHIKKSFQSILEYSPQ